MDQRVTFAQALRQVMNSAAMGRRIAKRELENLNGKPNPVMYRLWLEHFVLWNDVFCKARQGLIDSGQPVLPLDSETEDGKPPG